MNTTLRKFENIQDPFNNKNFLTGLVNVNQGDNYGQLLLNHINGIKCKEQIIYSTPKMHYPFDKNRSFYFKFLDHICYMYEKLDGTNIISFNYKFRGKKYTTYKTRLSPVVREGKFGNFFTMWKEMIVKYPNIEKFAKEYDINFSYELYGVLNKHLILYPIRLDTRLLFGLDNNGNIILPDEFTDLPIVKKTNKIKPKHFFPDYYKKIQEEIESANDYSLSEEVKGSEGRVLYINNNGWKQFKLKPPTIFEIHISKSGKISKNDIMITCYNSLENTDKLSYDFIVELLKEEFSENKIKLSEYLIKDTIKYVTEEIERRELIIKVYNELQIKLKDNKKTLMRKMGEHFNKKEMRYVYNIILAYENKI